MLLVTIPANTTYLISFRRASVLARNFQLRQMQQASKFAGEFLQRTERTQPAAKRAAPPDDQRNRDEGPQHHGHRIVKEEIETAAGHQRLQQTGDIDNRKLALGVPADEQQGEQQETPAEPDKAPAIAGQLSLPDQRQRQQCQRRSQNRQFRPAAFPDSLPGFVSLSGTV